MLEGETLRHCVGEYGKEHAKGKKIILFIRHYRKPERSYYTLNVGFDGWRPYIIQLHGYGNEHHGPHKEYRHTIPKEVTAFVEKDGAWITCKPQWTRGVKMLTFTDEDADETLFTADFDLDGVGRLKLSNVDNVAQEMEGSVILKGKCFLLEKRPYTAAEGLPVTDAA